MYRSIPQNPVSSSEILRWFARASSIVLFVAWILLLAQELMRDNRVTIHEVIQAAVLTLIFLGYAVAWRKELAGALIALLGIALYFVVCQVEFGELPGLAAAWFAFPSALYFLAWYTNRQYGRLNL
jgi:hypothetical protein